MKPIKRNLSVMEIYIYELAEIQDCNALMSLKNDIINNRKINDMNSREKDYINLIDKCLDEQKLRNKLNEIQKEF